MSKRFGRNQKRKMRERMDEMQITMDSQQDRIYRDSSRIYRTQKELAYLHERPVLMDARRGQRLDPNQIATFCVQVNRDFIYAERLNDRQLYNWIANELSRAVYRAEEFRGLIALERAPTCDISKLMELQ